MSGQLEGLYTAPHFTAKDAKGRKHRRARVGSTARASAMTAGSAT